MAYSQTLFCAIDAFRVCRFLRFFLEFDFFNNEVKVFKAFMVILIGSMSCLLSASADAGPRRICSTICYPPCPIVCCPPCQKIYKTGDDSSDLQVQIRGSKNNMLEIFFKENFERYAIPGGIDMCCNGRVFIPAKNELGTFAVGYGTKGFTAFGWKGNKLIPLTVGTNTYPPTGADPEPHVLQIDIDPACPIHLEWVTTRILRITHGPRLSLEYIVRFDGDAKPWKVLHSGPIGAP